MQRKLAGKLEGNIHIWKYNEEYFNNAYYYTYVSCHSFIISAEINFGKVMKNLASRFNSSIHVYWK